MGDVLCEKGAEIMGANRSGEDTFSLDADTVIADYEAKLKKPRSKFSKNDWQFVAERLAHFIVLFVPWVAKGMTADKAMALVDNGIKLIEQATRPKPPAKRGRPFKVQVIGLGPINGPRRRGRRPKLSKEEKPYIAIAVYKSVEREKKLLKAERRKPTDRAALEQISVQLGTTRGESRYTAIRKYYHRFAKLLNLGKKIVAKIEQLNPQI